MSYNGSGVFVINTAGQPVVTGTVISSTAFNALTADLGTGLSTAITKDGQTATTARIPFAAGINSSLVTDSTGTGTGSIFTAGGVGIAKALFVGTTANVTGVATFSAQPIFTSLTASSAVATDASKGLVSVTNTGTGNNVLATSPTLVTPILGVATATSINKVALTAPATSATLTIADGASLVTSGAYSLTLTATAATNVTLPTSGTVALSTRTVQVFTASGTYTAPAGLVSAKVTVIGGGGAGGGSTTANNSCGGGGGGGTAISYLSAATIGVSQTVTVGALVTGPTNGGGSSGGTSSFGSILSATGGSGGSAASASAGASNGGGGGVGTGGTLNFSGDHGFPNALSTGGGGGGGSFMGGGGLGINNTGNGTAGLNYGGGGAGGGSNGGTNNGGSGAAGLVFVEEFY